MKKSKIIVPALGIILLSTVASVTGTVAWFTANTKYNTEVSQFEVARLSGDLTCVLGALKGTKVEGNGVTLKDKDNSDRGVILGDSSFTGEKFYSVLEGNRGVASSSNVSIFNEVNDDFKTLKINDSESTSAAVITKSSTEYSYFYAVSWTMTFKYSVGGSTTPQNLFMNFTDTNGVKSIVTAVTGALGTTTHESHRAFRMAFTRTKQGSETADPVFVWAPFVATATGLTHVNEAGSAQEPWNGATFFYSDTSSDQVIGQFKPTSTYSEVSMAFNCYAWYEGTDHTNIVNETVIQAIKAALGYHTAAAV